METAISGFRPAFVLLLFGAFMVACRSENATSIQPGNTAPSAQVVNISGGRIDHANVGSVTFSEHLSYNRLLYVTDNGSYCGDGCWTGFSDVVEGTDAISISQTATSGAVEVGPLGSFQKGRFYAVNVRKVSGRYCAELWQRMGTGQKFNDDTTRLLVTSSC